ncbi:D-aminoacyl-tRNA deacylase [Desulforhopalus singaporensis]|uniref:D-aminoacyl-tRNA deacylase n=1 Tax=Desulforhopalus singaporensis TaxID=91360 RepID=A0A1H0LF24_9BACT|nr:D-aminoacyl-tRNA deacylase [Desulforhopalus singaporensis]SDO66686.1 D-tyrosyl-tRNA(Tyr) deacylase [Desulforhopalus singaporensis]
MRAVVQRVSRAAVGTEGRTIGRIGTGLLILLGIQDQDDDSDIAWMAEKAVNLRIFEDKQGKMNLSVADIGGEMLIISQFTLYGDCRKGRRPGFSDAARPEIAEPLYHRFVAAVRDRGIKVATGAFQADMEVELINDGPVTLLLDSDKKF